MNEKPLITTDAASPRRPWVSPIVTPLGTLAEVLQGGGAKQSVTKVDAGDPYKPKGSS